MQTSKYKTIQETIKLCNRLQNHLMNSKAMQYTVISISKLLCYAKKL